MNNNICYLIVLVLIIIILCIFCGTYKDNFDNVKNAPLEKSCSKKDYDYGPVMYTFQGKIPVGNCTPGFVGPGSSNAYMYWPDLFKIQSDNVLFGKT
tara:strand:- start:245 stop:535 length:291 start_codon:yes stop_codon:yes gene_type:complete